jgi:toxin YoeB
MNKTIFEDRALDEYGQWLIVNPKIAKRIFELIKDIHHNGFLKGIGKPEPLKHRKGCSRRIDEENRLVYTGDENQDLVILSCKGDYED